MKRVLKKEIEVDFIHIIYENNDKEKYVYMEIEKLNYDEFDKPLNEKIYKHKYINYNIFIKILSEQGTKHNIKFENCFIDLLNEIKSDTIYNIQNIKFQTCKINNYDMITPIRFYYNFVFEDCVSNCTMNINYLFPSDNLNFDKLLHVSHCSFDSIEIYFCYNDAQLLSLINPKYSIDISNTELENDLRMIQNQFSNITIRNCNIQGKVGMITNTVYGDISIKKTILNTSDFIILTNIVKGNININESSFKVNKIEIICNYVYEHINLSNSYYNYDLSENSMNISDNNTRMFYLIIIQQIITEFISIYEVINDELDIKFDLYEVVTYYKARIMEKADDQLKYLFNDYFEQIDEDDLIVYDEYKELNENDKKNITEKAIEAIKYFHFVVNLTDDKPHCKLSLRNSNLSKCKVQLGENNLESLDIYESIIHDISINYENLKTLILNKKEKNNKDIEKKVISNEFLILTKVCRKNCDDKNANKFKYLSLKSRYSNWILKITTGYGMKPFRLFIIMLIIMTISSIMYLLFGIENSNNPTEKVNLLQSIYFSVVTFSTLGFGDYHPRDEVSSIVAALEGISGAFLIGLYISLILKRNSD